MVTCFKITIKNLPGGNFFDTHLINYSSKSDNVSFQCQTDVKVAHFDVHVYLGVPSRVICHFKLKIFSASLIIHEIQSFYQLK